MDFLLRTAAIFLGLLIAYFTAVDQLAIVKLPYGRSYRQFLLSATDAVPGRIIIESGSSAIHSIDTQQIEQAFHRPTLIISDNAGYPLEHKIRRLENHLKAGDTVLLPLEWAQYRDAGEPSADYVASIMDSSGSNAFYYQELGFRQKVSFVYRSIPLSIAARAIGNMNGIPRFNPGIDAAYRQTVDEFRAAIRRGERGSKMVENANGLEHLTAGMACDRYLFGLFAFGGISDRFRANLDYLGRVREETGAQLVFTWPAVASRDDDECYRQYWQEEIPAYVEQIRSLVEAAGFTFIGTPDESRFDSRCLLDTYYHIKGSCAVARTQRLVKAMQGAGIETGKEFGADADAALARALDAYVR